MNQEATSSSPPPAMEEERYVKVASRFFRVKPAAGGAMARPPHYLESCFLCKGSISCNRDIFMYKGDAAFCSEDCRQEQMYMDDALDAVARQHKQPSAAAGTTASRSPMMLHRRPTIANLAAARAPVAAS